MEPGATTGSPPIGSWARPSSGRRIPGTPCSAGGPRPVAAASICGSRSHGRCPRASGRLPAPRTRAGGTSLRIFTYGRPPAREGVHGVRSLPECGEPRHRRHETDAVADAGRDLFPKRLRLVPHWGCFCHKVSSVRGRTARGELRRPARSAVRERAHRRAARSASAGWRGMAGVGSRDS